MVYKSLLGYSLDTYTIEYHINIFKDNKIDTCTYEYIVKASTGLIIFGILIFLLDLEETMFIKMSRPNI
jgi:hypothetical protein